MSIRRTIILLTVPLFLLLAMVNGALLYFQEKSEMSRAMAEQALAAAVASAEFISSMDRAGAELAEPLRARGLQATAGHVTGLDGLYLVRPGASPQALIPTSRPWDVDGYPRPGKPVALPPRANASGHRHVVALAPVSGGAFVAARIDAEPMFARIAQIERITLLIVLAAGVLATALAWFVARRIVRELEQNHRAIVAIGAGEALPDDHTLTISEVRDLAGAVRLMEASNKAAAERSRRVTARRDRERTVATALAARRRALFGPLSAEAAGAKVSARICGDSPPGSFFALSQDGGRAMLAIGRCTGASPQEAFARAVATRTSLQAGLPSGDVLAATRAEYGIEELRICEWSDADPGASDVTLLALTDAATAELAERYAARSRDASPDELLDGIALLLSPTGVFAAVSR